MTCLGAIVHGDYDGHDDDERKHDDDRDDYARRRAAIVVALAALAARARVRVSATVCLLRA